MAELIVAVAKLAIATPAMVFLALALIPTWVAFITDRSPRRNATVTIASLIFVGASPTLFKLFGSSTSVDTAIAALANPFNLAIVFGSAAARWGLVMAMPPIAAIYLAALSDRRLVILRRTQSKLIEEWGEDVTGKKRVAKPDKNSAA